MPPLLLAVLWPSLAGADLVVYRAGQTPVVCHLKGAVRGAWQIDAAHLAVATDPPQVLTLAGCSLGGRLAEFTAGDVPADPGLSWVIDGTTVRNRADGAPIARLSGQVVHAEPEVAGGGRAPRGDCLDAQTGGAGCDAPDLWQLRRDGTLLAGTLADHRRVRAFYPPEGDIGVGGLSFVADGHGWLLAAPGRSRQVIHLYAIPEGTLKASLAVVDPPDIEPAWRTCNTPVADLTGRLLAARCGVGMATWDRETGAHAVRPSPPEAEHPIGAVAREPRLGILVAAWGDTIAEWSTDQGWRKRISLSGKMDDIREIRFEPDGQAIWVQDAEARPRRLRWPTGAELKLDGPKDAHTVAVAFGLEGRVALASAEAPYLQVRQPGHPTWTPEVGSSSVAAAFLPDGRLAYGVEGGICIGEPAAPCDRFFGIGTGFSHLAASPDGRYLAFDPWHDGLRLLDLRGELPPPPSPAVRPARDAIRDLAWSKDLEPGHLGPPFGVWLQAVRAPTIVRAKGSPLRWPGAPLAGLGADGLRGGGGRLVYRDQARALEIDPLGLTWPGAPDGGALAAWTVAGWFTNAAAAGPSNLWRSGQPVADHPGTGTVVALASDARGQRLAVAERDGRIWMRGVPAAQSPSMRWEVPLRPDRVGLSPDGEWLWVAGDAGAPYEAPQPARTPDKASQPLESMALSAEHPEVLARWRGPVSAVVAGADGGFAVADGRHLSLVGPDGAVRTQLQAPAPIEALAWVGADLWLAQEGALGLDRLDAATGTLQRVLATPEGLRLRDSQLRPAPDGSALWALATLPVSGAEGPVALRWALPVSLADPVAPTLYVPLDGLAPTGAHAHEEDWHALDLAPGTAGATALMGKLVGGARAETFLRALAKAKGQPLDAARAALTAEGMLTPALRSGILPAAAPLKLPGAGEVEGGFALQAAEGGHWLATDEAVYRVDARGRAHLAWRPADAGPTGLAALPAGEALAVAGGLLAWLPTKGKPTLLDLSHLGDLLGVQALPKGGALVTWRNGEQTGLARVRLAAP